MTPRQRRKIRRATRRTDPDPSEQAGELNIVPFLDIVVNLMLFLLATSAAAMALAETSVRSPALCRGRGCAGPPDSLELSVTLADGGIVVASRAGRLGPGCGERPPAAGATFPRVGEGYDFGGLGDCLARLRARHPEEREVILGADPGVRYAAVIGAMDAIRRSFPVVRLSVGVR